jgi:hypothetical protein
MNSRYDQCTTTEPTETNLFSVASRVSAVNSVVCAWAAGPCGDQRAFSENLAPLRM